MRIYAAAFASVFALPALSSCATPKVVETTKITDNQLSCSQLVQQMNEAESFRQKAQKEKGITKTNAAAFIFFAPALSITHYNVNKATQAAETRKNNLSRIFAEKNCASETDGR